MKNNGQRKLNLLKIFLKQMCEQSKRLELWVIIRIAEIDMPFVDVTVSLETTEVDTAQCAHFIIYSSFIQSNSWTTILGQLVSLRCKMGVTMIQWEEGLKSWDVYLLCWGTKNSSIAIPSQKCKKSRIIITGSLFVRVCATTLRNPTIGQW